ncbi:transposase [Rhodobacter capsulatus]
MPEEFGKWSSVYRQFRRWTLAGLWEDVLDGLNHAGRWRPTSSRWSTAP